MAVCHGQNKAEQGFKGSDCIFLQHCGRSFTKEKFCSCLADARWYHLLGPSSLLMIGSPCIAWRDQKFHQSLVQGWLPLSLHVKPICQKWLDFTFEKHLQPRNFWWLLSVAFQGFGHWQKSKHRQGCSEWLIEVIYHRTLGIMCFGYMRIGAYFPVAYFILEIFLLYL